MNINPDDNMEFELKLSVNYKLNIRLIAFKEWKLLCN